jgi:hypothetical protein
VAAASEGIAKHLLHYVAYLQGLKRGAKLKAPVEEINGWNTSVRKRTEGGVSG